MDSGVSPLTLGWELARKALHLATVVVPLAYATGVPRFVLLGSLGAAVGMAVAVEIARLRQSAAGEWVNGWISPLLRQSEFGRWSGATWLLISFFLAVVLFPRAVAVSSMWAVAAGDASAGIIGRVLGRRGNARQGKTVVGSAACAVATALGIVFVARLSVSDAIVGGLVAAVAERPRGPLDDNVRVGLAVGVGILLSHMAFS